MNGLHDMGGMHGFGEIEIADDEPVFAEDWEARVFGIAMAYSAPDSLGIDYFRYLIECMPPRRYLEAPYYQRWLMAECVRLVDSGLLGIDELAGGHAASGVAPRDDAMSAAEAWPAIREDRGGVRDVDRAPRFAPGDRVRTANRHPSGHTRLPRYARGRQGRVRAHRGAYVTPDSQAMGQGEHPDHVYSVEFAAAELWGAGAAGDKVYLDLWESYLEPV